MGTAAGVGSTAGRSAKAQHAAFAGAYGPGMWGNGWVVEGRGLEGNRHQLPGVLSVTTSISPQKVAPPCPQAYGRGAVILVCLSTVGIGEMGWL